MISLKKYFAFVIMSLPLIVNADLKSLDQSELSDSFAQGSQNSSLNFIIDDLSVTSEDFSLRLDFDSGAPLQFDKLSLTGNSSANFYGDVTGFTLGSESDPFKLNLKNLQHSDDLGNITNKAGLLINFPQGDFINELAANTDHRFNIATQMSLALDNLQLFSWISLSGVDANGSNAHLWVDKDSGLGISAQINLHADSFSLEAEANPSSQPQNNDENRWHVSNLNMSLSLGSPLYQPLSFYTSDTLNFVFEIAPLPFHSSKDFYQNIPKGFLTIDNLTINNYESGGIQIEGIQIQHLKIETYDI